MRVVGKPRYWSILQSGFVYLQNEWFNYESKKRGRFNYRILQAVIQGARTPCSETAPQSSDPQTATRYPRTPQTQDLARQRSNPSQAKNYGQREKGQGVTPKNSLCPCRTSLKGKFRRVGGGPGFRARGWWGGAPRMSSACRGQLPPVLAIRATRQHPATRPATGLFAAISCCSAPMLASARLRRCRATESPVLAPPVIETAS